MSKTVAERDDKLSRLETEAKARRRDHSEPVTSMRSRDAQGIHSGNFSRTAFSLDIFGKELLVLEINFQADFPLIETQKEIISDCFFLPQLVGEIGEEVSRERKEIIVVEVKELPAKRPGG